MVNTRSKANEEASTMKDHDLISVLVGVDLAPPPIPTIVDDEPPAWAKAFFFKIFGQVGGERKDPNRPQRLDPDIDGSLTSHPPPICTTSAVGHDKTKPNAATIINP